MKSAKLSMLTMQAFLKEHSRLLVELRAVKSTSSNRKIYVGSAESTESDARVLDETTHSQPPARDRLSQLQQLQHILEKAVARRKSANKQSVILGELGWNCL